MKTSRRALRFWLAIARQSYLETQFSCAVWLDDGAVPVTLILQKQPTRSDWVDAHTDYSMHQLPAGHRATKLYPRGALIRARWQQLALPAGLIAVDLLSKAWAVAWLKADQPVDVDAGLQWVLRVNREGLGSWSRALAFAADARVAGAVLYAGFALAFLAFQRGHWTKWQKVAILALIFVTSPFLGITLNLVIPSLSTPLLTRLCGAALFGVLWWLSKPGLWRWATAFMVSAGLGNSLGLLVHGEGIVDFIYSRWMTSLLNMGVFNIADLYFNLAALCLTAWLGRWAARNAANATTRLLRPAGA